MQKNCPAQTGMRRNSWPRLGRATTNELAVGHATGFRAIRARWASGGLQNDYALSDVGSLGR